MIKLTVNPNTSPCTHIFTQPSVVIGREGDLKLPNEELLSAHVKILKQDNRFVIINQANDPFVTLNGLPFGKKTLKNRDLILIGSTSILFIVGEEKEIPLLPATSTTAMVDTEEKLEPLLDRIIHPETQESPVSWDPSSLNASDFDLEKELERLELLAEKFAEANFTKSEDPDLKDSEPSTQTSDLQEDEEVAIKQDNHVDDLLQQVEELADEKSSDELESVKNIVIEEDSEVVQNAEPSLSRDASPHQKISLKDYYLSEFDDENEHMNPADSTGMQSKNQASQRNWKFLGFLAGILFILLLGLSALFYVNMSDKNNEDEIKAAAGVADVSMALIYAQMNQGNPQNQNWSDPEFIKNNLLPALAPKENPFDVLNAHGQFIDSGYFIRIYTSSDLSHFLVIAQPAPSILHWWIPRVSIVVDSRYMELRKLEDLKTLNRILLNPNTLDSSIQSEISHIVRQGELIPLSTIADKTGNLGFSPPKFLGSIRPGAENLIYNAPRYYPFGEVFLKKALVLSENPGSSHEVSLLQTQLKSLEKYPNIILFSSMGMQSATNALKALNTFHPHNKLLVAHLKLNSKGSILSSRILMDDSSEEIAIALPTETLPSENVPPIENPQKGSPEETSSTNPLTAEQTVDPNHPLLLKLCALQGCRQQVQHAFETELALFLKEERENHDDILQFLNRVELLLKKRSENYREDSVKKTKANHAIQFLNRLESLLKKNEARYEHEEQTLIKSLAKLYEEYDAMPLVEFMSYINAAGLDAFVQQHLKLQQENLQDNVLPQKLIEIQISKIKNSSTLTELKEMVDETVQLLNLEKFPDPEKLIAYQAEAKVQVLDKLNDFFLSSEKGLPANDFTDENREIVEKLMKSAWVTDAHEMDFYLNEFDARKNK
jgi:hypothetical protein